MAAAAVVNVVASAAIDRCLLEQALCDEPQPCLAVEAEYAKIVRCAGIDEQGTRSKIPTRSVVEFLDASLDVRADGFSPVQCIELEEALLLDQFFDVAFFCGVTAGTTVFGVFDPFGPVADVCAKHGVWCHVDAAWGGAAFLSDTVAWKQHKAW